MVTCVAQPGAASRLITGRDEMFIVLASLTNARVHRFLAHRHARVLQQ